MHEEYKQRQQAVKDLQDVYVCFNQAKAQYDQYYVQQGLQLLDKQLEYLHALNLEQFDIDTQKAMLKCYKQSPELTQEAIWLKREF